MRTLVVSQIKVANHKKKKKTQDQDKVAKYASNSLLNATLVLKGEGF